MKPITRTTLRSGLSFIPANCENKVFAEIDGRPLCWVHYTSVERGIRPLPEAVSNGQCMAVK